MKEEIIREDRSNGDELMPRVSLETRDKFQKEIDKFKGSGDHLAATYLQTISGVNPIVAEYIVGVAKRSPEGVDPLYVVAAGVFVYRLLELEFEERGMEMPFVQREIADSLKVDIAQEERYFQKLAKSLVRENYEILDCLSLMTFWGIFHFSEQVAPFVIESGLGVYALIKAQAQVDRLSGL